MEKNTAGKWIVFAYGLPDHASDGQPITGDAANITANIRIDGGAANAVDDVNPTELEDGYYVFDVTAAEANGDLLSFHPVSSTANVQVIGVPGAVWTRPANFNALGIETDGDLTKCNLVATTTTNTDMRGTDSAATATALATAQTDLDTITGTDGATLATAQALYAPAKAGDSMALSAGAVTNASLAGNMEIVFETDFATNYNTTRNAWATNAQDFVGTSAADPFNGQVVAASVTGAVGSVTGNVDGNVTGSVGSNLELGPTEVNAEVDTALADIGLDHLISSALPTNWATDVASGSVFDNVADDGTAAFDRTTDSLQAIADSGGGGPTAAQIADAVWDEDATAHQTGGTFGQAIGDPGANTETMYDAVVTDAAGTNVAADVIAAQTDLDTITDTGVTTIALSTAALVDLFANDSGTTYGSAVAGSVVKEIADNAGGSALTEAGIADAVWDEALSGHVSAGTFGKATADIESDVTLILADTGELQTDDVPGLIAALNDPTAATIADAVWDEAVAGHVSAGTFGATDAAILADTNELQGDDVPGLIAALDTVVDRVETDTQDLQTQIGTAGAGLTDLGGMSTAMKAEVNAEADTAISDASLATAAALATVDANVDSMVAGIIEGAAATGTLTTTVATTDLTGYADDQLIGRIITVLSGAAAGESSDITDYANTNGQLTFTAMTVEMANTDTFKIT